ncbi:uncharacterized protein [Aristolochia californica]|uniref:uncharacterized protein n=1 Tax=Aristolochia californica TaxID=171875 RepID=UPI0035DFAD44
MVRALMCLELILNAVNLNLVTFSDLFDSRQLKGDIFSIFVIAIAAAEAAIGPAIVSSIHRCTQCVRACPTDVLEMRPWDGCKAKQIASAPRTEDCNILFRGRVFLVKVYLVFTTSYFPWLTIIVILPISAGLLIFFLPHRGNKGVRWYTICICLLELLLTTYAFCYHFQFDDQLIQLEEDYKWRKIFDFNWRLGIDGLSIGPI